MSHLPTANSIPSRTMENTPNQNGKNAGGWLVDANGAL